MHVDVCVKEGSNTDLQQKYFWVSVYEEILKISIFLPNIKFFRNIKCADNVSKTLSDVWSTYKEQICFLFKEFNKDLFLLTSYVVLDYDFE